MVKVTPFNQIAVTVVKSERLMWAADLSAYLFPDAIYHLIAVIPRIETRVMFTSLYRETVDRISRDALSCAEMILSKHRVLAIKKVILQGKPEAEIVNYVKQREIDLIVLTSGVTEEAPPRLVGKVTKEMIISLPNSLLIYPPSARKFEGSIRKALAIIDEHLINSPKKFLETLDQVTKRKVGEIIILRRECGELCKNVEEKLHYQNIGVSKVVSEKYPEALAEIVNISKDVDLVIAGKAFTSINRLTEYHETIAGMLKSPVILT